MSPNNVNPINASQMFESMQRLAAQSQANQTQADNSLNNVIPQSEMQGGGFDALLKNMVNKVNDAQQTSGAAANAYSRQETGADLSEAMIAMQKARVHFEAMVQVRNRLVSAYQEIMRMPV